MDNEMGNVSHIVDRLIENLSTLKELECQICGSRRFVYGPLLIRFSIDREAIRIDKSSLFGELMFVQADGVSCANCGNQTVRRKTHE